MKEPVATAFERFRRSSSSLTLSQSAKPPPFAGVQGLLPNAASALLSACSPSLLAELASMAKHVPIPAATTAKPPAMNTGAQFGLAPSGLGEGAGERVAATALDAPVDAKPAAPVNDGATTSST